MAISEITAPQELTPVYNDCFCIVDSTNKAESGFRYIAQIYVNGTLEHEFTIAPEPDNSYGIQHLSKLIASYLTYSHLFGSLSSNTIGQFKDIDVKWGEEYSTNVWDFDDYGYAGASNWTNFTDPAVNPGGLARTMLYVSTNDPPPFVAGDMINVRQDSILRPELEGIQMVIDTEQVSSAPVEWMVVLDKPWIGSGVASPGETDYADGSKSTTLNLLTQSFYAFNGAEPFVTFKDWDYTDWKMDNPGTSKFLTSVPRSNYRVRPDSKIFLQIYQTAAIDVEFESGGAPNGTYSLSAPNAVEMIDASPDNLTDLDDYIVKVTNSGTSTLSEELQFLIDTKCYNYADVEICFMDRKGSILPFQFRLKRSTEQEVDRETYKHDITTDTMYDYDLIDAGEEDLHISEEIIYTLRTARLTQEEAEYLRELISSPFTVVRFGDGEYMRCHVITRTLEIKDEYWDGPRTEDIQIRLSNDDIINW